MPSSVTASEVAAALWQAAEGAGWGHLLTLNAPVFADGKWAPRGGEPVPVRVFSKSLALPTSGAHPVTPDELPGYMRRFVDACVHNTETPLAYQEGGEAEVLGSPDAVSVSCAEDMLATITLYYDQGGADA